MPEHLPRAEIGQISVGRAFTSQEAGARLLVTIPVSARVTESWKDRLSLSVTAALRVPRGFPALAAYSPNPEARYLDRRATASGSAGLSLGVAQVSGGLSRPVGSEDLVIDVTGAGEDQVIWTVDGRRRELAGSQKFSLETDEAASHFAWAEVTALLTPLKSRPFFRKAPPPAQPAYAVEPLITQDAPQAAATLVLYEGDPADGRRFFVGRPLNLSLTVHGDSFAVARERGARGAGAIRWVDDADGQAGYTWVQFSATDTVEVAGRQRPNALIVPGSELRVRGGMPLSVSYDVTHLPGWAVAETFGPVLEVDVVIDGEVTATRTADSDYVTVGRALRDISINRPDISRSHGAFHLGPDGWTYCQQSTAAETEVIRDGGHVIRLRRDDVAPVAPGDVVRLTPNVSLVLK